MKELSKEQLDRLLFSLVGSTELVTRWWESPNKAFNNLRPIDVDQMDVQRYILSFCFGDYQ